MFTRDKFFKKLVKIQHHKKSICIPNLKIVWSQNNASLKLSIIKIRPKISLNDFYCLFTLYVYEVFLAVYPLIIVIIIVPAKPRTVF